MTAAPLIAERFVRRTQLGLDEYRKNFRQLDQEVIVAVTSPEADAITPLMSKVYLRLVNAPESRWERVGVLRFAGEEKNGEWITAWEQLVVLVGVASATARKALRWMHEQGIVGYFAGKNGVGIRIFLNRAASSIGRRPVSNQKNLRLVRASNGQSHTSESNTPFRDSFADLEVLETDLNPRAPKSGAENIEVSKLPLSQQKLIPTRPPTEEEQIARENHCHTLPADDADLLLGKLECTLRRVAAQEHERTREWLESRGLPKAARVAQREAYNVLRRLGIVSAPAGARISLGVGRREIVTTTPRQLSTEEVRELAETCLAMLEVHGQAIDVTLSELSMEIGGMLLPGDAQKVRELAETMLESGSTEQRRES